MPGNNDELIGDIGKELTGIARQGMEHPSTKPVLTAAALGAVAGALLPIVTWPIGLVAGAGYMVYKRVRP
jgi:di/tricarboxylate transporter